MGNQSLLPIPNAMMASVLLSAQWRRMEQKPTTSIDDVSDGNLARPRQAREEGGSAGGDILVCASLSLSLSPIRKPRSTTSPQIATKRDRGWRESGSKYRINFSFMKLAHSKRMRGGVKILSALQAILLSDHRGRLVDFY